VAAPVDNYEFAFDGWLFGGPGQGVQILEVSGLEDQPDLRIQDDSRGYIDGMFTGRDFLNGRYLTFTLQIMNDANDTMQTYLAQLKANLAPQQTGTGVLQFQLPGRSLQRVNTRVRKRNIKIDPLYVYGQSFATVEMFCPDPRIYDDTQLLVGLNPTAAVGRVYTGTTYTNPAGAPQGNVTNYPVAGRTYNLVYNTPQAGGTAFTTITTLGNTTVFPTFTITGAMTDPTIVNSTTGQYLSLSITTSAADTIVIDPELRSITYNGDPARNLLVNGSQWFGLPPGSTTLGIIAPTADAASQMQITYRNGYV
jgi:hypothetical protein